MSNRTLIIIVIILLTIVVIALSIFLIFALLGKYDGVTILTNNTVIFDESYEKYLVNGIKVKSDLGDINLKENNEEKSE